MTFTEIVTAAYEREKYEQAQADAKSRMENEQNIKGEISRKLGVTEGFTVSDRIVTFDCGVILEAVWEYNHTEFRMRGSCPQCGNECYNTVSTLAGIGEMLVDFKPYFLHRCKTAKPDDDAGRLIEALKNYINSQIDE